MSEAEEKQIGWLPHPKTIEQRPQQMGGSHLLFPPRSLFTGQGMIYARTDSHTIFPIKSVFGVVKSIRSMIFLNRVFSLTNLLFLSSASIK